MHNMNIDDEWYCISWVENMDEEVTSPSFRDLDRAKLFLQDKRRYFPKAKLFYSAEISMELINV